MLLTIAAFVFVLSIVVIVHELGHFIAAKLNGIYVITFSVGFGPKILKLRIGETEYALSILPFGGYVKFAGETDEEEDEKGETDQLEGIPEHRYYRTKSPLQRMSVVFAGPFMNAFMALTLYIMSIWIQGIFIANPSNVVSEIVAGSPAEVAGLEPGDRIISVNEEMLEPGKEISDLVVYEENVLSEFVIVREGDTISMGITPAWNETEQRLIMGISSSTPPMIGDVKRDGPAYKAGIRTGATVKAVNDTTVHTYIGLQQLIHGRIGVPMKFTWILDGETFTAEITPEAIDAPSGGEKLDVVKVGAIGINEYYEKRRVSFGRSCVYGTQAFTNLLRSIIAFLGKLVTGKATIRAVGGPIRVGVMAGDMIRWGFNYLISFLAFFSLNLAIFNLLPILPFDGGHFVIFLVEAVTGMKPGKKAQAVMAQVGFILLIALMGFIFIIDMFNLFG
jgi:regulator of sigma E protease